MDQKHAASMDFARVVAKAPPCADHNRFVKAPAPTAKARKPIEEDDTCANETVDVVEGLVDDAFIAYHCEIKEFMTDSCCLLTESEASLLADAIAPFITVDVRNADAQASD
jgi:hypothetical protein